MGGCRGKKVGGEIKEKEKKKKGSQERQGHKQLLLGDREGQANTVLINSLNGLCWRVALLSQAGVLGWLAGPRLPSSGGTGIGGGQSKVS